MNWPLGFWPEHELPFFYLKGVIMANGTGHNEVKFSRLKKPLAMLIQAAVISSLSLSPETLLAAGPNQPQVPDWAKEFYGPVTFRLMDDPVYAEKNGILGGLLSELNNSKALLKSKQDSLAQKNQAKQQKVNELDTTQKSLDAKNDKLNKNTSEIQTLNAEVTALENAIGLHTGNIRIKENELITLNNVLNPFKEQLAEATQSRNERQNAYNNALAACQQRGDTADCTDDAAVIVAKHHLDRAKERVQYLSEQVAHYDQLVKDAQQSIANSQQTIATSRTSKEQKQARVTTLTAENAKLRDEIPVLITNIGELTRAIDKLNGEATILATDVTRIGGIVAQQEVSYANEQNLFKKIEQQLIEDVLSANRMGYAKARSDGQRDGIEVARIVGDDLGERQGKSEGTSRGVAEGRARELQRGREAGEQEGTAQGRLDGVNQGQTKGREEGHRQAGAKEGQAAGITRAEASDAAQVGRRLGAQVGVQRAKVEGERRGRATGENEAINFMENRSLSQQVVRGPFAGTFANPNLPAFPGARGTYRNDESGHSRRIIRMAYIAGYSVGYDRAAEEVYYANIEQIFTESYQRFYQASYAAAVNSAYPEAFRAGREEQFRRSYDREYQVTYNSNFEATRAQSLANPDRNSSVYKNAFKTTEGASFETRYVQIKDQNLEVAASETFNQNIAQETEMARMRRLNEVKDLYSKFPVVKFQSANITDIGIELVGINDSIVMPGESIAHNITLTNYSDVEAKNLTLSNAQGEKFTIDQVPARSTVTLLGIGRTVLDQKAKLGKSYNIVTSLKMDLTSNELAIQGRHFENSGAGLLKGSMSSTVTAQLPVQVGSLALTNPLILNHPSQLVAQLQNISSRSISGPITVRLDSSAGRGIISRTFKDLDTLTAQATINDAEVLIDRQEMIFQDVDFSLAIYKNGVLLGYLSNVARDYVKANYIEKAGAPVVVVNSLSRFGRDFFKDVANELGGLDRLSVLDMAGGQFHQEILDRRLNGKTVLIVNDREASVVGNLENLLKSKNVLVGFISNERSRGSLTDARSRLAGLRASTSIPFQLNGKTVSVVSTAPVVNDELDGQVSLVELDISDLDSLAALEQTLKLSADQLIDRIAKRVTSDSFFRTSEETLALLKTAGLRNLEEAEVLADAYDKSKGARRFLFFKLRDKSMLERVKEDNTLFVNKLRAKLDSASGEEKIGLALAAYAIKDATMNALEGEYGFVKALRKFRNAYDSSFDKLTDKAEKVLKAAIKGMKKPHKQAEEKAQDYRPYPAFN